MAKSKNTFKKTKPWFATEEILRSYLVRARPFLKGKLLDAGCGSQRYRDLFAFDTYVGMEISEKFAPDVVGDIRKMPFGDNELGSILNSQVLEHVDDTHAVFSEFRRVLKPGSYLCITVPFIARIHEVPHNYWRISEFGLRYLFDWHGFEEIQILPMGGSLTTQAYLWQFKVWEKLQGSRLRRWLARRVMWFSNRLFLAVHRLDSETSTLLNYFCLAKKELEIPEPDLNT